MVDEVHDGVDPAVGGIGGEDPLAAPTVLVAQLELEGDAVPAGGPHHEIGIVQARASVAPHAAEPHAVCLGSLLAAAVLGLHPPLADDLGERAEHAALGSHRQPRQARVVAVRGEIHRAGARQIGADRTAPGGRQQKERRLAVKANGFRQQPGVAQRPHPSRRRAPADAEQAGQVIGQHEWVLGGEGQHPLVAFGDLKSHLGKRPRRTEVHPPG